MTPLASIASPGPNATIAPRSRLADDQRGFAGVLARAHEASGAARPREAAEQFVASALVEPVLKQLRETNHATEPFAPNAAERSFRGLMDAQLAQRLVRSSHWGLVDRVAATLEKHASKATPAGSAT